MSLLLLPLDPGSPPRFFYKWENLVLILLIFVLFNNNLRINIEDFSGIRTRTVKVEGEQVDQKTLANSPAMIAVNFCCKTT